MQCLNSQMAEDQQLIDDKLSTSLLADALYPELGLDIVVMLLQ
jgi:hypothetical protein